jgi:hypothetical protein
MGRACGTREGEESVYMFWWGDQSEGDHLEDLGVDGRKILKLIFKKWIGEALIGLLWIALALVNAIMNLRDPQNAGNFLTS